MGLALGLALGLRVRPPDIVRKAGEALIVPGAAHAFSGLVWTAQALTGNFFVTEMIPLGLISTLMLAGGIGLRLRARWGWWCTVLTAVVSLVIAVAWALSYGLVTPIILLPVILLTAGIASIPDTRLETESPRSRRIVRGGRR
jgi:hypothetical protein